MRKKRLSTPGSAETLTEVGAGASLKKLGGESGASPEKPSKPGGRRVSGSPKPRATFSWGKRRSRALPGHPAPTYGVQRSLNSLAMVSMPPARATAM